MRLRSLLAAALIWASTASAGWCDQAVVVGVNQYPKLPQAPTLSGCVGDATAVGDILKGLGFKVNLLTDGKATRQGILSALRACRAADPNGRFVFYFAGHGYEDPACLLVNDSSLVNDTLGGITPKELNDELKAIQATSRSVLLDSCFSGGMARAVSLNLRARLYRKPRSVGGGSSKDLQIVANQQDKPAFTPPSGDVCYMTAAQNNEPALEDPRIGHGLFTLHLMKELKTAQGGQWGSLHAKVKGGVVDDTKDAQHPVLTPNYVALIVFQSPSAPKPPVKAEGSLWEIFNTNNLDPSKVLLTMKPNLSSVKVDQRITFEARVGATGYLVIAEKGTSGKVNLLFPEDGKVKSSLVQAGKTVTIPSDATLAYTPDKPGHEHLRAMLFRSEEHANQFIEALYHGGSGQGLDDLIRSMKGRDLKKVAKTNPNGGNNGSAGGSSAAALPQAFYTSEVIFEADNK